MFPISLKSLSDQERHNYVLQTFILNKSAAGETQRHKRDIDVIKENHRFLWDNDVPPPESWGERLARRYYDKLFKEYCIVDLTRHKENKVALRWRTEAEVISGKGQFECGSRNCTEHNKLRSWEVNFAYREKGEHKNALVKLRLCEQHSAQLNYTSRKREVKRLKRAEKHHAKQAKQSRDKSEPSNMEGSENADENEHNVSSSVEDDELNSVELPPAISDCNPSSIDNETENVWNKKLQIDAEVNTRENEFERYLEDLLL